MKMATFSNGSVKKEFSMSHKEDILLRVYFQLLDTYNQKMSYIEISNLKIFSWDNTINLLYWILDFQSTVDRKVPTLLEISGLHHPKF
jgi:hypothetical protein